jgi:predicted O-methyltransferase YrrM
MSILAYLHKYGNTDYEGNSCDIKAQTDRLIDLCSNIDYATILEIGFNAGHSANTFLSHTLAHVTSLDLNVRGSVIYGKEYIDKKYPGRHTLIIGDSTVTLPEYIASHPDKKFDLIFIDGGHTYDVAISDLMNCKNLAHSNTVLIMDDVVLSEQYHVSYTVGPTQSWIEAINGGHVQHAHAEIYALGRGMSWGKYIL